jgi:hypothetical protein
MCLVVCVGGSLNAGEVVRDPGFFLIDRGQQGVVDTSVFAESRWHWAERNGERLLIRVDSFGRSMSYGVESQNSDIPVTVRVRAGELYVTLGRKTYRHGSFGHFEQTYVNVCGTLWPHQCIFVEDGQWMHVATTPAREKSETTRSQPRRPHPDSKWSDTVRR